MGMLTGKYDDGVPEDSRFGREEWAKKRFLNEENAEKVRQLRPIAEELGITRAQLALAWCNQVDGVTSTIIGATNMQQLKDNIDAFDIAFDTALMKEINQVLNHYPAPF